MVRGAIYRQSSILASLWGEIRELPSGVVRTKRALVRFADFPLVLNDLRRAIHQCQSDLAISTFMASSA